jgi:hypothetical protein
VVIPPFLPLPPNANHPPHPAWAVLGENDELRTLNHLTNDIVVTVAREEVRTGTRVGLTWSLQQMRKSLSFRNVLEHQIGAIGDGFMHVLLSILLERVVWLGGRC